METLADTGHQGLGARTGGRMVAPPHLKFMKAAAPDWYEELHERRRKAHTSRRIRVEHGIAHLRNWQALARHLGRREHMSDTIQAVAGCCPTNKPQTWPQLGRCEHATTPTPSTPHRQPCTSS
ncbi:transposase [Streptomyces uncialis]|uniref:transposase n=1 Tax=Streptomyces uncialis TaxID=1048205 RepID=UPI0033CB40B0